MLRLFVLVVLVANLLFWSYSRGWLDGVFGLDSNGDREPDRLARQVRPETIRILPAASQASGASAAGDGAVPAPPAAAAPAGSAPSAARAGAGVTGLAGGR